MFERFFEIILKRRRTDGDEKSSDPGNETGCSKKTVSSCCNSFTGKRYSKEYKVFKCPECSQKLRVPREMGKIKITCRRCKYEFVRKT